MTSRHPPSVRQPISCEPCRRRKIKCSRTPPPCETCRRRGYTDSCVYKGSREEFSQSSSSGSHGDLLNRIRNLESLLINQASASRDERTPNSLISPPLEISQLSPESLISESLSPQNFSTESQSSHSAGLLTISSGGNTQYEPRSSQWNSVLANTKFSVSQPILDDQDDSTTFGFPFTTGPVPSHDELLSHLPPGQQCDYLKDKYFEVFSPVSAISHQLIKKLVLTWLSFFTSYTIQLFILGTPNLSSSRLWLLFPGWQSSLPYYLSRSQH